MLAPLLTQAQMRTWTLVDGRTFEAQVMSLADFGDGIGMRDADGREFKISQNQLSANDRNYIKVKKLQLDIDFSEHLDMKMFSSTLAQHYSDVRPPEERVTFSVRVKQRSNEAFDGELVVEFYAFGTQRDCPAKRFILLAYKKLPFKLTEDNGRRFEYRMPKSEYVPLPDIALGDWKGDNAHSIRGRKYDTYLVTVSDTNGNVIAHRTPNKWLYENLDNLRKLPVRPGIGAHVG